MKNCTISKSLVIAAALMGAVAFTSCSRNEDVSDNGRSAVRFASSIGHVATLQRASAGTRAAGTTWTSGDSIGVFMVNMGTKNIAEDANNKKYTTSGNSSFTGDASNIIYYPMDGSNVDFIAYYPYKSSTTLTAAINVTISVEQTTANQPTFDLLYAATTGKYSKASTGMVPLTFGHQLTKLVINTKAGEGLLPTDLAKMTIKINGMNTANTFNLSEGKLGATSTIPSGITPRMITDGSEYDAIIMPATFAANAVSVVFTLDKTKEDFTWKIPAGTFAAGKVNTYDITLARTGVTFTGTITDWDTGTGGSYTAN